MYYYSIKQKVKKMEEEGGNVVPTADALDVLLKVEEDV
jgi:hypothetical protein